MEGGSRPASSFGSPLKRQAAKLMGISPRALSYYLEKYPLIDESRAHLCGSRAASLRRSSVLQ